MSTLSHSNPMVPPSALTSVDDVLGAIRYQAGTLPQIELDYNAEIRTLWITLQPAPKPVFTLSIIDSVRKVQAAIMGEQVRVSSPSKDELQTVVAYLRGQDFGVALQFGNYR